MQKETRHPDQITALSIIRHALKQVILPGDCCIDATAGRGYDTQFLCECTGPAGQVLAFDIQPEAVASTKARLEAADIHHGHVFLDTHEHLANYAKPESAAAITFNFGWLPGADHGIMTKPESSLAAIKSGLPLLRKGGLMTLAIYSGKDTGFAERDAILAFLPQIDTRDYTVLQCDFINRGGNPPLPVLIYRMR